MGIDLPTIIPFYFDRNAVRVVMRAGEPWFVAADVCAVLDIGNSRQALTRLDDDEKGVITTDTLGGNQEMTAINESGLYSLILTSRKPAAKRFKKWVTAEVLPAIRKTGRYEIGGRTASPEIPAYAMAAAQMPTAREVNAFTRLVGEVRRMAGRGSAVVVYVQTPLQSSFALPDELTAEIALPVRPAPLPRHLDGEACLRRLLSARIARTTLTVGDLLRLADGDAITRNSLSALGLRLNPENWRGWIAIASAHSKLQAVFTGSAWAEGWETALQTLPGARIGEITGFGRHRRAVLIPSDAAFRLIGTSSLLAAE